MYQDDCLKRALHEYLSYKYKRGRFNEGAAVPLSRDNWLFQNRKVIIFPLHLQTLIQGKMRA